MSLGSGQLMFQINSYLQKAAQNQTDCCQAMWPPLACVVSLHCPIKKESQRVVGSNRGNGDPFWGSTSALAQHTSLGGWENRGMTGSFSSVSDPWPMSVFHFHSKAYIIIQTVWHCRIRIKPRQNHLIEQVGAWQEGTFTTVTHNIPWDAVHIVSGEGLRQRLQQSGAKQCPKQMCDMMTSVLDRYSTNSFSLNFQ